MRLLDKMWSDSLLIVFISICTAFLGEGKLIHINFVRLNWLKHYRTVDNGHVVNKQKVTSFYYITGLTWILVYRTEKYQKLKVEVERQSKKCKCYCRIV